MEEEVELKGRNYSRSWTSGEIETLRNNANLGVEALALLLGRSVKSVKSAACRMRISLRPQGERRGLLLGQPRDTAWRQQIRAGQTPERLAQIREDVLAGDSRMSDLERRALEIAMGDRQRPVCPACGARPQERKTTGLCEVCHLRALAQAHREDQARRDAQRELWRARQEASRLTRSKKANQEEELEDFGE